MIRRVLTFALAVPAFLVATTTLAAAHVDVDPGEAVAGSTTTLTFSFHHGKDGTATTALEVLMPAGATVLDVPEVAGWGSSIDEVDGTVTWSGGSAPDGVQTAFTVTVRLPDEPGVALFKTIQTTEAGELAWIEEDDSEGEGRYPAPRVDLIADPDAPTSTTAAPTTSGADTTTTERPAGTTVELAQRDDGDNSPGPWLIGSGLAALAAIGIGGAILKRRAG